MIPSITTTDIAPFGPYSSHLASRLGGLKTAHELSQFEAYGKYAEFIEGDGDRDESVRNEPIGSVVNPNAGALRETPVELRGNITWCEMHAAATCPLDVDTPDSLRIEYKPLPPTRSASPTKSSRRVAGPPCS